MTVEVSEQLEGAGVKVQPYERVLQDVEGLAAAGTRIWMDPSQVLWYFEEYRCSGVNSDDICFITPE